VLDDRRDFFWALKTSASTRSRRLIDARLQFGRRRIEGGTADMHSADQSMRRSLQGLAKKITRRDASILGAGALAVSGAPAGRLWRTAKAWRAAKTSATAQSAN